MATNWRPARGTNASEQLATNLLDTLQRLTGGRFLRRPTGDQLAH